MSGAEITWEINDNMDGWYAYVPCDVEIETYGDDLHEISYALGDVVHQDDDGRWYWSQKC